MDVISSSDSIAGEEILGGTNSLRELGVFDGNPLLNAGISFVVEEDE